MFFAICYREEKRSLKFIKEILEPFRVATRTLEGDTATAGHVIPVVRLLHKRMWELKKTHPNNQFIEALQNSMDRRLSRFDGAADTPIYKLCASVDPRFKLQWCTGKF